MILQNKYLSPSQVLLKKFIEPSGLSLMDFTREMNLPYKPICTFLGYNKKLRPFILTYLCKATNTEAAYWLEIELNYLFENFNVCNNHQRISPIKGRRIKSLILEESLGKILYDNYIIPSNTAPEKKALYTACKKTKIDRSLLYPLLTGKRKINFSIAQRISNAYNTSIWYWIDIQNKFELKSLITSKKELPNEFKEEIEYILLNGINVSNYNFNEKLKGLSIGKILELFLKKSSHLKLTQWCTVLLLTKKHFKQLIAGKEEFSISFILKLCIIFNTSISFWLFYQAKYYERFPKSDFGKLVKTTSSISDDSPLFKLNQIVKSYNWSLLAFSKHIGVKHKEIYRLKHGNISFEIATRIGQGLEMDPKYWLNLCLQHNLKAGKYALKL